MNYWVRIFLVLGHYFYSTLCYQASLYQNYKFYWKSFKYIIHLKEIEGDGKFHWDLKSLRKTGEWVWFKIDSKTFYNTLGKIIKAEELQVFSPKKRHMTRSHCEVISIGATLLQSLGRMHFQSNFLSYLEFFPIVWSMTLTIFKFEFIHSKKSGANEIDNGISNLNINVHKLFVILLWHVAQWC